MSPVAVAAAPERSAKRRKMVRPAGDDKDDATEGSGSGRKDKTRGLKPQAEKLSIRGGPPAEKEESETAATPQEEDEDEELTDSPSAQLMGTVRSARARKSRSRSRTGSEADEPVRSRSASSQRTPFRSSASRSRSRSRSGSDRYRHHHSHNHNHHHHSSLSRSSSPRERSLSRSRSPSDSDASSRSQAGTKTQKKKQHTSKAETNGRARRRASQSPRPQYRRVFAMRGHAGAVSQVRISPDGRWIASASADGTARIWDAGTGAHMTTLVGHLAGLSCVAWSPDSNTLATGSDDKSIRLWDRVTAEPAHALVRGRPAEGEDQMSTPAAVTTRREAGNGARGTRLPLLGHHNYVYCLAFSPKGNMLASGSYDEAVFLWDVRAGRLMRSLPAHSDPVSGIDFCCDGTLVVSCSTDGLIRIWDTGTGQCLRTLLLLGEDNPAVTNVCFSPNGRYVLAFNLDSCIRLWDYVATPSTVKKTYQGHANTAFSIGGCFGVLADGRGKKRAFVAAASEDGDVVLWDVGSKAVVQRLRGAHAGGMCFWVDVCGATMVSCGQDGWINVYRHGHVTPT